MLWLLLSCHMLMLLLAWLFLFKEKRFINYHLGMNVAMVPTGLFSLSAGLILLSLYPEAFIMITIITTCIGLATGIFFGSLIDKQGALMGFSSGIMSGIMAPMLGAMAADISPLLTFSTLLFLTGMTWLIFPTNRRA
ncbi:hypothetical protein [Salsuginibacillus kocurii]|uniref:hypothetical protein n=1 Tax=Salsuginibacillus kocurii TaxID=427078 RepID=UPI000380B9B9|nr:hypothetical protein [Salsuginibacillus kocurii]